MSDGRLRSRDALGLGLAGQATACRDEEDGGSEADEGSENHLPHDLVFTLRCHFGYSIAGLLALWEGDEQ
jgi:hypothetical protein